MVDVIFVVADKNDDDSESECRIINLIKDAFSSR